MRERPWLTERGDGGLGWSRLSAIIDTFIGSGFVIFSQLDIWWGAAETAESLALIGAGGDIIVGGAVICLTGVGCIAGAPAVATGVGMIGTGVADTADGIGRINDGLGKALREANGSSSIISENEIPESLANWLTKKGIPWEVISR
ncbi:hypothetical protein [Streptomyces tailanensis]|uniref:hypothetical protein n=1 Tax=Streptomyces tailanensis TaxID=2569858 RepID=UPI00122E2F5F|nr:hypothetical protein [Streptomyces tailanensis]